MLIRTSELRNFVLEAIDGEIGRCRDFLFDDEYWTVRYMEVNTGKWLPGRRVLISPAALETPRVEARRLPVQLEREDIQSAPTIETDQPVSRQYETAYSRYYDYSLYWVGGGVWGGGMYPYAILPTSSPERGRDATESSDDPHLRSSEEVVGYSTHAIDGDIGSVNDLVVDTESWTIGYLALDTRRWRPGRTVLLPIPWASNISWVERKMSVDVTKQAIETALELKDPISKETVTKCFKHFVRFDPPGLLRPAVHSDHYERGKSKEKRRRQIRR